MFKKIRFFGEKSLSSLIYIIIMAMLLFSGFAVFFTIMGFILGGRQEFTLAGEFPLGGPFRLLLSSSENIKIASDYFFKSSLYQLPAVIVNLIRYYYVATIFQNFSFNLIFTKENFKRLRDFGILSIVYAALYDIANYFAASELSRISIEGAKVVPEFNLISGEYLLGITIIIFAEAFKRAITMKEEQELTV